MFFVVDEQRGNCLNVFHVFWLHGSKNLQKQTKFDRHSRRPSPSARSSTSLRGTEQAFWATSIRKEVFTRKAVRLLFEIAARPIPFLINSLQVVDEH